MIPFPIFSVIDSQSRVVLQALQFRRVFFFFCFILATTLDLIDAKPQRSISSWTYDDVISWLKEVGLENRSVD